ncbi:MAG: 3'-5' exonuclease [Streptomycetaceae bacterium]|nr:3'-5' exonuclease [Kutzneria sp.]MBV9026429.1 3'-5' exonuclease [Streptomycetaceae bacterium]
MTTTPDLAELRRTRARQAPIEQWARDVLADPGTVALDLETTGLGRAYVVEAAVVRMDGTAMLDTLVNPRHPISPDATKVHGLTEDHVRHAPTWPEILPELTRILADRRIVIYHAAFDRRILRNEMDRYHRTQDPSTAVPTDQWHPLAGQWVEKLHTECAMKKHAEWVGQWSTQHDHWRYWPLPGDHRAAGDCRALIRRLRDIAGHQPGEDE